MCLSHESLTFKYPTVATVGNSTVDVAAYKWRMNRTPQSREDIELCDVEGRESFDEGGGVRGGVFEDSIVTAFCVSTSVYCSNGGRM